MQNFSIVAACIASFVVGSLLSAVGNWVIYSVKLKNLEAAVYGEDPDTAAPGLMEEAGYY